MPIAARFPQSISSNAYVGFAIRSAHSATATGQSGRWIYVPVSAQLSSGTAVQRYVRQNQGTTDEANDVFQDTLLVLMANIGEPDFQLTASLKTYVFSISKHLWLKHLKQKQKFVSVPADELADNPEVAPAGLSVFEVLGAVLASVTARCLALLTALFLQKKSIDTLVNEAGYTNRHTAQNQKYKCLEQARRHGRDLMRQANDG